MRSDAYDFSGWNRDFDSGSRGVPTECSHTTEVEKGAQIKSSGRGVSTETRAGCSLGLANGEG
jgi:hypothetical protein